MTFKPGRNNELLHIDKSVAIKDEEERKKEYVDDGNYNIVIDKWGRVTVELRFRDIELFNRYFQDISRLVKKISQNK